MYDVARHKWGTKWRMPRVAEVDELIDECTWEPMKIGDQCGCKITGKNGNSIFLPTDLGFVGHILPVYIGLTLRILNMVVMERAFWLVMVIVVT